ncbi:PDR/VanB family oxidoreductase [Noviherbaspirillum saxi]|uniref:Oxidoreductase n=1 Tax=Noviherbaspirillum saxi TaxID=2320863 RepID=A0A3A3FL68_9BURK|nr:PDR/VanB family oxidoreductase [Noviherbaspirillum saxi]RJF95914.1 oxidoreductase [Noviherbaspirillum saxi]
MNQLQVKVVKKITEAEGIASFELMPVAGELPSFSAGAHIDVHTGNGHIRQYSLCNDPAERHRYLIAVLHEPESRGGSRTMHERINQGDTLTISEPRNHFALAQANRTLLFAGGIGITPILCMAEQLQHGNAHFELHYCTRSPERTAFIDRIVACAFADKVHFHFDSGSPDQKLDYQAVLGRPDKDTHLYICGPAGFITHVTATAKSFGWSDRQLHVEYFGVAAPVVKQSDEIFEVRLASSGAVYLIPPDETVISALAKHGIDIPSSCEQGICGTCITRVIDGVPDHRDLFLTEEERAGNDQFTPCCSRAKTRTLVLDL